MRWGYPTRCAETASSCTSPGGEVYDHPNHDGPCIFRSVMSYLLATHSFDRLGAPDFLLVLMSCTWAALHAAVLPWSRRACQGATEICGPQVWFTEKMVNSGCKIAGIIRRCRVFLLENAWKSSVKLPPKEIIWQVFAANNWSHISWPQSCRKAFADSFAYNIGSHSATFFHACRVFQPWRGHTLWHDTNRQDPRLKCREADVKWKSNQKIP